MVSPRVEAKSANVPVDTWARRKNATKVNFFVESWCRSRESGVTPAEIAMLNPGNQVVKLRVDDEHGQGVLTVPRGALELLARILAHLANSQGLSVVPANAELTGPEAEPARR
jgi:hypothetical protein